MASTIFQAILDRNIEQFVGHISEDSSVIFKDEKNKLVHPGEYGKYKEESCKQILRLILNKEVSISDGFVITADNSITTQCDIIIYNSNISPIIADDISRMFPAEEVRAIIEVKSNLSKSQYIEALRKMSKNKKIIIDERKGNPKFSKNKQVKHLNTIGSFLICNKLDFDINSLSNEEIYGEIDRKYWHNSILAIENGLIHYVLDLSSFSEKVIKSFEKNNVDMSKTVSWQYPIYSIGNETKTETVLTASKIITINKDDKYNHIKRFLIDVSVCCGEVTIYTYEPIRYLGIELKSIYKRT